MSKGTIDQAIVGGYLLCVEALRVQRDFDKIEGLAPCTPQERLAIRKKYSQFNVHSFTVELQAHAFAKRHEALNAVEGRA